MADLSDRPEPELLAGVADGDDAAFAVIYQRYLPVVLRWCLHETGSPELASDLSAEVFAEALIASRRYRPERGSVLAWLLGIARNKLRESRRRQRVENAARKRLGVEVVAITDDDIERVVALASLDNGMMARLADLSEDQRDAIVSRIIEEQPYKDIASDLSCSESVIRQRVSRGLKTLRGLDTGVMRNDE